MPLLSTPPNEIASRKFKDSIDVMKVPMDICPEEMLEQTENLSDLTPLKENQRWMTNSQHKKPKKADKMVNPQDYVCTSEDIEVIKLIMSAPKNTKFVDIGDAFLSNDDLQCLTRGDGFLPDGVLNAYIYCISACDHLRDRAGGKVYLDTTFASAVLKQSERHRILKRVHLYVKHDMVLFPINISKTHWYLAVINAKKRVIQVLDSLGAGMDRSDLTLMLQGLEKHLKIASQMKDFNIGDKWKDLDVTEWPIVEHFQEPTQTDGASCGLFMLNYMEYWTGDMLSDHVTQEDMKEFRLKLVVILVESELNKIKGKPIYYQPSNEENVSNSDCMIMDGPELRALTNEDEDRRPISVHMMPMDPRNLVDELCKHIMSIQDAKLLEQEWVRSSKPYPIGLSLKKIQDILRNERPMDNDCFNLGIRIVACDEILQMVETDVHYMDLRFCTAMVDSTRGPKWRVKPNSHTLAALFNSWPGIDYKISSRKLVKIIHLSNIVMLYVFLMVVTLKVLLPYASAGDFNLFSIDKHASSVSILDPLSVLPSPEGKLLRSHNLQLKLQRIAFYLSDALALAQPGWDADIFLWSRRSPVDIPKSSDRNASGYFVFYIMISWNGKELVHPICANGNELRKKFLVHLLKDGENEAKDNIPSIVWQYLRNIKE